MKPSDIDSNPLSLAMNLEQFLSMGGYAFYVWTAYAVAFAVLLANLIVTLRRKAEVFKSIERLFKLERPRP
jgi:heme exporter protein D